MVERYGEITDSPKGNIVNHNNVSINETTNTMLNNAIRGRSIAEKD
jgi:hypothetical protein